MALRLAWSTACRTRRENARRYELLQRLNAARRLAAAAAYRSITAFYAADSRRRGEDVPLASLVDGELRYTLSWLPGTRGRRVRRGWADDADHPALFAASYPDVGFWATTAVARFPELVFVLGRAASAEETQAPNLGR